MLVEQLRFRVEAGQVARFQVHNRRWLAALDRQSGFLGQRIYRDADRPEHWLVTIAWRDKAALAAFPEEVRRELEESGRATATLERSEQYLTTER